MARFWILTLHYLLTVGVVVGLLGESKSLGAAGDLLWEDQFQTAGGAFNIANALAVAGRRVFAAGVGQVTPNNTDFLVRAYDAATGALLWEDQFDKAGLRDEALALAVAGGRIFAAGFGEIGTFGNLDFLVRAYDAATGTLLWEDQFDEAGGGDQALAIAAAKGRVFAAGFGQSAPDPNRLDEEGNPVRHTDFLVRAYDAATGALLWQDLFGRAGDRDEARAIAVAGGRVFVAGRSQVVSGNDDFLVRAYDAATGTLLWEDQFDKAGSTDIALAIAVTKGRVFAAGRGVNAAGNTDFLVRAYDAVSGGLRWEDQVGKGVTFNEARAVATARGRLFAAGETSETPEPFATNAHFLVRAYEAF